MLDKKPELAEELLGELARARIASGAELPADTVQMGSTLTYEADGQRRRVTLVYPQEADIAAGRISVLTPIGTALSASPRASRSTGPPATAGASG